MAASRTPLLTLMLSKIRVGNDNCWRWTRATSGNGYGQITVNGRAHRAHRVMYQLYYGTIPDGLDLDHLCRVRHCVNPDHLEPVTRRENTLRGVGVAAMHAQRTHCPQGHEYTDDNLVPSETKRGNRECLTCNRERSLRQGATIRAAAAHLDMRITDYKAMYGSAPSVADAILAKPQPVGETKN